MKNNNRGYAIGVLASDVEAYSARTIYTHNPVSMGINELGGLFYRGNGAIITLTVKGATMQFLALGSKLEIYVPVNGK